MDVIYAKMNVWADKAAYDEAEKLYYEKLAKYPCSIYPIKKTSLAEEVAKTRERIRQSLENVGDLKLYSSNANSQEFEKRLANCEKEIERVKFMMTSLQHIVDHLATNFSKAQSLESSTTKKDKLKSSKDDDDDDGVDLFGSESEEEDKEAKKLREQRVAEYTERKAKKPTVIAKSNIILDVKPWDDETNMQELEKEVRKVAMDGLVWGASKVVPLAYGIKKLQISCVVEDEKVAVDDLQEKLQEIDNYVRIAG